MSWRGVLVGLCLLGLGGCSSTREGSPGPAAPAVPGPLLRKQIAHRIANLKFQRGVALLDSLNWLILYGEAAVPQLLTALQAPDPRTRAYAAYVLGEIGDRRAVPPLRRALARERVRLVRYETAAALVTLGDWGQVGLLIEGLADPRRRFRHKCFEVLEKQLRLTLGYDPDAPPAEREQALAKWRAWWERNRAHLTPVVEER